MDHSASVNRLAKPVRFAHKDTRAVSVNILDVFRFATKLLDQPSGVPSSYLPRLYHST